MTLHSDPVLQDIFAHGLQVVFCGMAAGSVSAQRGTYYAGPGNKFWTVLHSVGFTSELLHPSQYRRVEEFGIGLTDVIKWDSGPDSAIRVSDADRIVLQAKLEHYQPRVLAFNGKRAAKESLGRTRVEYGLQTTSVGNTRIFVLPSTSGAANGYWSIRPWQELYSLLQDIGHE